jgi:3-hydroxyacyl-CoA dehydrogenase
MPGVLIVEALAQVGAVSVLSLEDNKGKLAFFGGIDKAKFRRQVRPGDRLKLEVEIIKCKDTRDDVAQTIYDVSLTIGKKPVIVKKDVAGFSMNRIQFAVIREALAQVADGVVSVEDMDNVVKYGIGIRWACQGPIESIDFGGLQTQAKIAEYMMPAICDSHEVPELLKKLAAEGANGIQNGHGFYEYPPEEVPARLAKRNAMLEKVIAAKDV